MQALLAAVRPAARRASANASGRISPTRAEHVLASLGGRIPLIVDGGADRARARIDDRRATGGPLRLLRPGPIELDAATQCTATRHRSARPARQPLCAGQAAPARRDRAADGEWLIGFGAVAGDATLSASGDLVEAAARLFDPLHHADAAPHRASPSRRSPTRPRPRHQRPPAPRRGAARMKGAAEAAPFYHSMVFRFSFRLGGGGVVTSAIAVGLGARERPAARAPRRPGPAERPRRQRP